MSRFDAVDGEDCCCCTGACGLGAVEYKDKIDCLRSGRDTFVLLAGAAALEGLEGGFDCEEPKNSKPSKESPPVLLGRWAEETGTEG